MIILIEGMDGSGKETQAKFLAKRLGIECVSFPRYGSPGASLLEAYLHGDLSLSPYGTASAFALDRACWAEEWRAEGMPDVVIDRYVFSNIAYQGVKFDNALSAQRFIDWDLDFEYRKLNLPAPNVMIYLVWEKSKWKQLLSNRGSAKHDGNDIHESNDAYLDHVYDFGLNLAKREGAILVRCDGLSKGEVHNKILHKLQPLLRIDSFQHTLNRDSCQSFSR